MEKVLHLTLKKKWFDMIASGEKKEEYREIKPYWIRRLMGSKNISPLNFSDNMPHSDQNAFDFWKNDFDFVIFKNGYRKDAATLKIEFKGLDYGKAKPEWSDNWQGDVFIIKLGDIFQTETTKTK